MTPTSDRTRRRRGALAGLRALPASQRRIVLVAGPMLMLTRVSLRFFPMGSVNSWLDRVAFIGGGHMSDDGEAIRWIPRAVTMASRHVPGGRHCLTKAMVARALLEAAAFPVELRAGVRRWPDRRMTGHAWLEHQGQVVMDAGEDPASFTPLSALQETIDESR